MKFKLIYTVVALSMLQLSCKKELAEVNKNPNAYEKINPDFLFTNSVISMVGVNPRGDREAIMALLQQQATFVEVEAIGDKYNNENYVRDDWAAFSVCVNQIQLVIQGVKDDPEAINKFAVARIWRAYLFHRLTDLYGDIPYSEANKSLTGLFQPKYDLQSYIYTDMLKELEESANSLDASKPTFGASDLFYKGNTVQWKKFAYSLMLRLAMRLTKVDPVLAKTWVEKAISGGPIIVDADLARIPFIDGSLASNRNPFTTEWLAFDFVDGQNPQNLLGGKMAKTFIDQLKGNSTTTKDPRLNVISVLWVKQPSGVYVADTSTALQKGMQNAKYNAYPLDFETYSEPNPNTVMRYDAPFFVMTPAEVNFLLAEAAIRGWYSGNAGKLYEAGVSAAMRQMSLYGNKTIISKGQIDYYLANNPFKAGGTFNEQLEQISIQKWILFFLDQKENFANWRRTGYPKLIPTNYPGNITGGQIPRRYIVPQSEEQLNTVNFLEAKKRQSGDNTLLSRVWWDKE
ncbi:MAG: SusD/RagB family nutrient-binding outer membrane lipoprotein [Pedobacter sp.]|jgi:hypothetical protein